MPHIFLAVFIPSVAMFLLITSIGRAIIAKRHRNAAIHAANWRAKRDI